MSDVAVQAARVVALAVSVVGVLVFARGVRAIVGVVSMLFENPVVIPRSVAERLGISDTGARKLLAKLAELDIIHEVAGVYPKACIAAGIMAAARR